MLDVLISLKTYLSIKTGLANLLEFDRNEDSDHENDSESGSSSPSSSDASYSSDSSSASDKTITSPQKNRDSDDSSSDKTITSPQKKRDRSSSSSSDAATTIARTIRQRNDRYPSMPAWQVTDYKHGSTFLINQGGGRFIIHISNYRLKPSRWAFRIRQKGRNGKNSMVMFESLKERMKSGAVAAVADGAVDAGDSLS